jgi:hypothetical protein
MANLIDKDLVRAVMTPGIELLEANTFPVQHIFKATEAFATTTVDLDIFKGQRKVGGYVKRFQEGNNVDKIAYTTKEIAPPYLKPKVAIMPSDIYKRMEGEQVSFQGDNRTSVMDMFFAKQLNYLESIIERSETLQAVQALWNGEIVAKNDNNETLYTLNFGRDAALTYTVGTLWSASGANPLKDLANARKLIQEKSGFRADFIYGGFDAIQEFLASEAVFNQINNDYSNRGRFEQLEDIGGVYYGRIAGFDVWGWDETYTDTDGTEKAFFPDKKILVGSTRALATKLYAGIENVKSMIAAPRYLDTYNQDDPSAIIAQLHSAPMMVTNHPDAYATLTVLS